MSHFIPPILTCSKGFTMKSTFSDHTCAFWLFSSRWWHDKIWLSVQAGLNKMFFCLYVQFMWVGWSVAQIKRTDWQRNVSDLSVPCSFAKGIVLILVTNSTCVPKPFQCLLPYIDSCFLWQPAFWLLWNIINAWFGTQSLKHINSFLHMKHMEDWDFLLLLHYLAILFITEWISICTFLNLADNFI